MMGFASPLHYDGAPRAITRREAERIATRAYMCSGRLLLIREAGGALQQRGQAASGVAATAWRDDSRRDLADWIMSDSAQHIVFYDRSRDRFYGI